MVLLTYWSIALAISARFTPLQNFMSRTRGWCLSHQLSALSPARRVQWIRDCWPAPIPITCQTQSTGNLWEKHGPVRFPSTPFSSRFLPVHLWHSRQSWTGCTWQRWWPQWGHAQLPRRAWEQNNPMVNTSGMLCKSLMCYVRTKQNEPKIQ